QPGVGSILKAPKDLIGVGDTLFFSFDEPGTGRELWRSDGTAAGTKRVADINPGPFSSKISSLTLAGNRLYFAAESINLIETELWALDVSADLNEPPMTTLDIAAVAASKAEGHTGLTPFTFRINRSGDTTGTSSVRWSTAGTGSSPTNAADFNGGILPSGTVTFAAGETSKTLTVNVKGDRALEAVETFRLSLFSPLGATLSPTAAAASGTILNDDGLVSIAANSPLLQDSAKSMGVLPAANVNPPADLVNRWLSSPSPIAPLMNPSLEVFGGGLSVDLPFAGLNSPPQ
ncbi:MAG: ELWxxDGT repeat protein, partial [Cyanobium sp.]